MCGLTAENGGFFAAHLVKYHTENKGPAEESASELLGSSASLLESAALLSASLESAALLDSTTELDSAADELAALEDDDEDEASDFELESPHPARQATASTAAAIMDKNFFILHYSF